MAVRRFVLGPARRGRPRGRRPADRADRRRAAGEPRPPAELCRLDSLDATSLGPSRELVLAGAGSLADSGDVPIAAVDRQDRPSRCRRTPATRRRAAAERWSAEHLGRSLARDRLLARPRCCTRHRDDARIVEPSEDCGPLPRARDSAGSCATGRRGRRARHARSRPSRCSSSRPAGATARRRSLDPPVLDPERRSRRDRRRDPRRLRGDPVG